MALLQLREAQPAWKESLQALEEAIFRYHDIDDLVNASSALTAVLSCIPVESLKREECCCFTRSDTEQERLVVRAVSMSLPIRLS